MPERVDLPGDERLRERLPEPVKLMDEAERARACAAADFADVNRTFLDRFRALAARSVHRGQVRAQLDAGGSRTRSAQSSAIATGWPRAACARRGDALRDRHDP
jgi:hypothetical protein